MIEVDKRIASDAHNAYIMPNAIEAQESNKNEALHRAMEMAHLGKDRLERGSLNIGVLKVTNENVTKQLGARQETRVTI